LAVIAGVNPAHAKSGLILMMPPILAGARNISPPEIQDLTPNTFYFIPRENLALNTHITSNQITVSGITGEVQIAIIGGTYSVNGAPFTSEPSMVTDGQTVRVNAVSAGTYSTTTEAIVTIGWMNGVFSLTTRARPPGVYIMNNDTSYLDGNYLHVIGEVHNYTTYDLPRLRVGVYVFGADDRLIGYDYADIHLDNLPAGEKTCFDISIRNITGEYRYRFESVTYKINGKPLPNLAVFDHRGSYDFLSGRYEITGTIRNDSGGNVAEVRPVGTVYNSAAKVIGCDAGQAVSTNLSAGQSSPFAIILDGRDYADASSYRLQVNGN
jgi:hypothetical protein